MISKKSRVWLWAGLMLPLFAFAKPEIAIEIISEKEVVVEEKGKQITKKILAKDIEPGEKIIFTITYSNKGDEVAKNVEVKNPIPEGALYVDGSAKGKNSDISFSIDGGKTYKKPGLLMFDKKNAQGKTVKTRASIEKYTHIRWLIKQVSPGEQGQLEYLVKVQ